MEIKGFIDIHTHGIGRYDTKTDNPEDILKIAQLHAKAGTAAILPTIHSGTIQQMRTNMKAVKKAMKIQKSNPPIPPLLKGGKGGLLTKGGHGEINNSSLITTRLSSSTLNSLPKGSPKFRHSSLILGVHLEGPFLNPIRCGAQDKDSFIKPSTSNLKKLIDGYEDIVKVITIAPELSGALKVIGECVSLGIKVNMGHSDATHTQALNGKKAGARGISHIFNAMRPFHHREPGLIGLGLLDEDIYIEIIADNIHINKIILKLIFQTKRLDRVILVSDSIKGAKDKKGPIYPVRRKAPSELSNGVYSKPGVLAGSLITIADAVKNIKDIGIPESIAIEAAVDNPKRYLTGL